MKLYLIDPSGKVWPYPATALAAALGRANPDIDIWSYAVKRLGAVEIAIERDVATVSWCATKVTKRAIRRTESLLAQCSIQKIRFCSDLSSWMVSLAELGATLLSESLRLGCRPALAALPRPTFTSKSHPEWWRHKRGQCTRPEFWEFIYRHNQIDRSGLFAADAQGEPVFLFAGTDFHLYDPYGWVPNGRRLTDQPDAIYAAWCANTYRQIFAGAGPRHDFVDANVRLPGSGSQRLRYDRLLLPWVMNGQPTVSLFSLFVPSAKSAPRIMKSLRSDLKR
jgi:hypothetical protein